MKILLETIKDVSLELEKLTSTMCGSNYIVELEVRKFQYNKFSNFTIDALKELYASSATFDKQRDSLFTDNMEIHIEGTVGSVCYEEAQNDIERCIKETYYDDPNGVNDVVKSEIAKQRLEIFWNVINNHFTMPPTHCFQHKPENHSFFGWGVMWEFCYILLNDNTKEGIVIAGQAYD